MHRRKWDAKTEAMIIIEGLKGKPRAEICTEHQISQSPRVSGSSPITSEEEPTRCQ